MYLEYQLINGVLNNGVLIIQCSSAAVMAETQGGVVHTHIAGRSATVVKLSQQSIYNIILYRQQSSCYISFM